MATNTPYGLHDICDDVVHLQHAQSYMGCRQLLASYWMNLCKNKMNYVKISTKSDSDLSFYTEQFGLGSLPWPRQIPRTSTKMTAFLGYLNVLQIILPHGYSRGLLTNASVIN